MNNVLANFVPEQVKMNIVSDFHERTEKDNNTILI